MYGKAGGWGWERVGVDWVRWSRKKLNKKRARLSRIMAHDLPGRGSAYKWDKTKGHRTSTDKCDCTRDVVVVCVFHYHKHSWALKDWYSPGAKDCMMRKHSEPKHALTI